MTNISIRCLSELPEKAEVIAACDSAFANPVTARKNYPELLGKIHSFGLFFAACTDEPVGYIAMYANDNRSRTAFITLVAVKPGCQGMGIAGHLMERALSAARENGMEKVRLEVKKGNNPAISLYQKYGFLPDGQETEHTIFMTKPLV